ncbi:MAG: DUF192 domain-containing protein [Candidatus Thermoplasmatota archaeon]
MDPVDRRKDKFIYLGVIIIVSIILIWYVSDHLSDSTDFGEETIAVINSEGEKIELSVEIAETQEEQEQGLMNRDSLCENCGMLFVYEEDVQYSFWMKDTQIPLSIAFISENGTIMEIQQMEPETTDPHEPEEPYRYALEVNQGFFEENHVNAGDVISIPDRYE